MKYMQHMKYLGKNYIKYQGDANYRKACIIIAKCKCIKIREVLYNG